MAWEYITHACGHEVRHQLYGRGRDREWNRKRLAERTCEPCYRAEQERERAEASARARETATAQGLPPLTGTPKQLAWAETLRHDGLAALDAFAAKIIARCQADVDAGTLAPDAVVAVQHVCDVDAGQWIMRTDAATWIDARRQFAEYALAAQGRSAVHGPLMQQIREVVAMHRIATDGAV